jgi:CubicO group peptidase (beta-lactamase class C family)
VPARYPNRLREDWTLAQLIDFFKNEPFDFEPGTKWHYDNSGYVLLGAILEKVTGKPYAELVSEWIFTPLGMKDALRRRGPDVPRRVDGYQVSPSGVLSASYLSMTTVLPAGSSRRSTTSRSGRPR